MKNLSAQIITLIFTVLITLSMISFKILPNLKVGAQAGMPLIWMAAPQTVTAPETKVFNISVWLESSDPINVSSYQVYLTVENPILSVEDAWVSAENESWIFHGETYVPVNPVRKDNDDDGIFETVMLGSALIVMDGTASVAVTDAVLLGVIELQVLDTGMTTLNISKTNKWTGRYETFVLDPDLDRITAERQNEEVEIEGYMPTESSTISLEMTPTQAFAGQNVTISGQIVPDKPNVEVKIEQRQKYLGGYLAWGTIATVKTDQTSQYSYIHRFLEAGTYQLKASWSGDETHQGNWSRLETIVREPTVMVEMRFANEGQKYIGEYDLRVPTEPTTMNVTVRNVTDLYYWRIKIYYDQRFLQVDEPWLPADNPLNLTGLEYNATLDLGEDEYGNYLLCEATITETGNGYTGNATLFQFNITGLVVTTGIPGMASQYTTLDIRECALKNSTGNNLIYGWNKVKVADTTLFEGGVFYIFIAGTFSITMEVVNPRTGGEEFIFYSNDTSVGTIFNVTVRIRNALSTYGWQCLLAYDPTLLNVTQVIKPEENSTYVFYGKESTMDYTIGEGSVWINNTSTDEEPFEGDGLLAVIKFEILMVATNQTGDLSTPLAFNEAEVFTGVIWQPVAYGEGTYRMIYGAAGEDGDGEQRSWLETYWPYLAGVVIIIVILTVYLVMRRMKKRRVVPT